MHVEGNPGYEQVSFSEPTFTALLTFLAMIPDKNVTELIFRLSEGISTLKVAELYNVLIWSAEERGGVDPEVIQTWFYGRQPRRIAIALQVDIFPSNGMEESKRILEEIATRYPSLAALCSPLLRELDQRLAEEEAWAKYRRDTFEMPKEMTPDILAIIHQIKGRR